MAKQAQTLAQQLNYKKGIASSYGSIGIVYHLQSNYPEALKNYFAALKIAKEIDFKDGIADNYNNIGNVYIKQGNYPVALKNYFASLKIREETGNRKRTVNVYINIGNIYTLQGNYTEGLKYYFSALKIAEDLGFKKGTTDVYSGIGNIYALQGNYPEGLKNYFSALKIQEELNDKKGIAISFNNIGNIYNFQSNYSEALKNYLASLKIKEEIGDKGGMVGSYINIGDIYNHQKQPVESKTWLQKGLLLAQEIGANDDISLSYGGLAQADSALGNYQEAYTNYKQHIIYRDSLFNEENTKKLVQTAMQYDFDKKEIETQAAFDKRQDSLKLEQQKEIELKQLHYEYEKKQALAKTVQERQKLVYEEELKRQTIENDYKQKQAKKQAEYERKEAAAKAEQEKKDAIAKEELQRKNLQRNASIGGLALMFLLASVFFTQRNRINKEKKRSDALLLNILPWEVAEELKEHGESEAKYFDEVSVLFTDFVDFTLISENLLPKELVKELHTCFKAFDDIITRHGLEKIKTIGDAYMAVCGLPLHNAQHAQNTVKAAQEILQFINKRKEENPNGFRIRIGINSGSVVAGIVGVKKFSYDIWGDAVNTAARMESNGEAGRINISGSTYELVKEVFKCEHRGKIQAKGKGEVDMYFIT